MVYKLIAHSDIKYRLMEWPTTKDGYAIPAGDFILINDEGLKLLHVSDCTGRKHLDSRAYRLERRA